MLMERLELPILIVSIGILLVNIIFYAKKWMVESRDNIFQEYITNKKQAKWLENQAHLGSKQHTNASFATIPQGNMDHWSYIPRKRMVLNYEVTT
jgi:hypothetical protein